VPVAVTEKDAGNPEQTVCGEGLLETEAGELTVRAAAELVALPQALVMTQS
jgi:hypothetical protein